MFCIDCALFNVLFETQAFAESSFKGVQKYNNRC